MCKSYNQSNCSGFTLIEILVVMGILATLAAIVLVAINPARQFAQARNTERTSNVTTILNAVGQYMADNQGSFPSSIETMSNNETKYIGDNPGEIDLCNDLVDTYLATFPQDPQHGDGTDITLENCSNYGTNYQITKNSSGRITVTAPEAELEETISVTR